jgi:hypothetical protein
MFPSGIICLFSHWKGSKELTTKSKAQIRKIKLKTSSLVIGLLFVLHITELQGKKRTFLFFLNNQLLLLLQLMTEWRRFTPSCRKKLTFTGFLLDETKPKLFTKLNRRAGPEPAPKDTKKDNVPSMITRFCPLPGHSRSPLRGVFVDDAVVASQLHVALRCLLPPSPTPPEKSILLLRVFSLAYC